MIAILINSLELGGAQRIAMGIASHIKDQGQRVVLLILSSVEEEYKFRGVEMQYLTTKSDLRRGYSFRKLLSYPVLLVKLIRFVKKNDVQLVQSHLFTSSILNALARIFGCRHQVHIVNHTFVSREKKGGFGGRIKLVCLRFAYSHADLLVSISKKMKSDIELNILRGKNVNHVVIPNPHKIKEVIRKSKENLSEFKFQNTKRYIVCSGRLIALKRIDLLIQACANLFKQYLNYELIIVGDGNELKALRNEAVKRVIGEKVHFIGHVDNPFKFIANTHIFVLSSEIEGLPNTLIEAMICKVPVVSTDCTSGPREILAPETDYNFQLKEGIEFAKYGILTPVGDALILEFAIKEIIENYAIYKKIAEEAFSYVEKYDSGRIMKKYEEVMVQ